MISVDEAMAAVLKLTALTPVINVALRDAVGLALAEDVCARNDSPPFDNSAVDGYAVHAEDLAGTLPLVLDCVADVPAGTRVPEALPRGVAARVMTGAPIPPGANAMVMVEDTTIVEGYSVQFMQPASPGDHIRPQGSDFRLGDLMAFKGDRLTPGLISQLASAGIQWVKVHARCRVLVVTTGDELQHDGDRLNPGRIWDSNGPLVRALINQAGAECIDVVHVPDELEATITLLDDKVRSCSQPPDLVLLTGGVSVGDRDFVKPAIEALGALQLWKVAMKPGKPIAVGQIGKSLVLGLPGNPASVYATFHLFAGPAIRKSAGFAAFMPLIIEAELAESLPHHAGRREFARGTLIWQGGKFLASPFQRQGSGSTSSLGHSNALLVAPEDRGDLSTGERVTVLLTEPESLSYQVAQR